MPLDATRICRALDRVTGDLRSTRKAVNSARRALADRREQEADDLVEVVAASGATLALPPEDFQKWQKDHAGTPTHDQWFQPVHRITRGAGYVNKALYPIF